MITPGQRSPHLLEITGLSKAFPGVQALQNVSLRIGKGEIHALVGENGAGKSTLMKVLGGIHPCDSGQVLLDGRAIHPRTPAEAIDLGIRSVHQEVSLAPDLTVAENIFAGREPTRWGCIRWRELHERTTELLNPFGMTLDPGARVGSLSLAMRQVVEIARALSHRPRILMLDEPTSSLEVHETRPLFGILRTLAAQGIGILYVTHKLKEVFELAQTITVLRDGKWVATKPARETQPADVVKLMVGRELTQLYPPKSQARGGELLRVEGLALEGQFSGISFCLHQGEILGLAGLVGAGRTEVAQTLFGRRHADAGQIWLEKKPVRIASPADAVRHRIAYLPEDRKAAGIFGQMSLADNLFAADLGRYSRLGMLSARAVVRRAEECVRSFDIRPASPKRQMALFSGGNQQKALLARWLDLGPRVLIADEPTRGIDVGAKAEIHALLRRLCGEGVGVIVISSELPEVLGLCDRILVLREGRLAGELSGGKASEEAIMRLATGENNAEEALPE